MLSYVLIYLLNIYQKVLRIVNFFCFQLKWKATAECTPDHMEHHPRLPPLLTALSALFVMLFLSLITTVVIVQSNLFNFEYISRLLLAKYRCKSISCAFYRWIKNRITHLKLKIFKLQFFWTLKFRVFSFLSSWDVCDLETWFNRLRWWFWLRIYTHSGILHASFWLLLTF